MEPVRPELDSVTVVSEMAPSTIMSEDFARLIVKLPLTIKGTVRMRTTRESDRIVMK
jgi:hypothetical protein